MKNTFSCLAGVLLLTSILIVAIEIQPTRGLDAPDIEWSRTYGGANEDVPLSVIQTDDGGYAMAGRTSSFGAGNFDFWLVKTDGAGEEQWNKTYGSTGNERAEGGIVQTADGGYLLVGHKGVEPNRDMWIVKTDSDGNMTWNRTFGGSSDDTGRGAVLTDDGGYLLLGNTKSFGAGDYDFWLIKTNSTGHAQWNKTYGGSTVDLAASLVRSLDGGYTLAGRTNSFGAGSHDFWLVKANLTGGVEWTQTLGTSDFEAAYAIVQMNDGGYAVAGQTGISGPSEDFWLVKTNATGGEEWNTTYGGGGQEHDLSMVQSEPDNGLVMVGYTDSFGAGSRDFWAIKTDVNGTHRWNQTFGGNSDDIATSVIQTGDGGFAIAGCTKSYGNGNWDFWLVKLAPEGIPATVDIDPDTLNLWSYGNWITAYVELPEGCNASDIDAATVKLNNTIVAEMHPDGIGDEDSDGIPDLMVKFDRAAVAAYIMANVDSALLVERRGVTITLAVTGNLNDGTAFEGSDTIKVMCRGGGGIGRHALIA